MLIGSFRVFDLKLQLHVRPLDAAVTRTYRYSDECNGAYNGTNDDDGTNRRNSGGNSCRTLRRELQHISIELQGKRFRYHG